MELWSGVIYRWLFGNEDFNVVVMEYGYGSGVQINFGVLFWCNC